MTRASQGIVCYSPCWWLRFGVFADGCLWRHSLTTGNVLACGFPQADTGAVDNPSIDRPEAISMTDETHRDTDRQDFEDALRLFLGARDDEQALPEPPVAVSATVRRRRSHTKRPLVNA